MRGPAQKHGAPGDHDAHKHAHEQEAALDPLEVRSVSRHHIDALKRCNGRATCDQNHPKHPQVVSRDRANTTRVG